MLIDWGKVELTCSDSGACLYHEAGPRNDPPHQQETGKEGHIKRDRDFTLLK